MRTALRLLEKEEREYEEKLLRCVRPLPRATPAKTRTWRV